MKFFRNNFVVKFLSLISLSILLLNIVNKSLYVHSHQLENGEIVTHAHPFNQENDNNPLKSHKHTSLEYLMLSAFDVFLLSFMLFVITVFVEVYKESYILKTVIKQFYFYYKQNKSPPILNSI